MVDTASGSDRRIKTLVPNVGKDTQMASSSPSSVQSEHDDEEEKDDAISLSTSSISTTPTPENLVYAKGVPRTINNNNHSLDTSKYVKNSQNTNVSYHKHKHQVSLSVSVSEETGPSMLKQVKSEIETIEDDSNNHNNITSINKNGKRNNNSRNRKENIKINDNIHSCGVMEIIGSGIETTKDDDGNNNESEILSLLPYESGLHEDFHKSPEPITKPKLQQPKLEEESITAKVEETHQYHLLYQIQEDRINNNRKNEGDDSHNEDDIIGSGKDADASIEMTTNIDTSDNSSNDRRSRSPCTISADSLVPYTMSGTGYSLCPSPPSTKTSALPQKRSLPSFRSSSSSSTLFFIPQYTYTKIAYAISKRIFDDANDDFAVATWLGFWAYLNVTCANYVIKPITDAVVLQVGFQYMPQLSLASSVLAFLSSVPIGWLFEAPDPSRRKVFKKMGMTRGETQGTSLALFYRFFAASTLSYAVGFQLVDIIQNYGIAEWIFGTSINNNNDRDNETNNILFGTLWKTVPYLLKKWGQFIYIAFFLVVHLMKLHATSLVWGVTTEAMEYEEIARKQHESDLNSNQNDGLAAATTIKKKKTRLQRLARIQFGGTLGGIWGSILASSLAKIIRLPGLLVVSAFLLEISAQLSIELGRIMQKHWEEQQIYKSNQDLAGLDSSMKRSASFGSMKRVASGNSLHASQQQNMKRVASGNSIHSTNRASSRSAVDLSFLKNTNEQEAAKRGSCSSTSSCPTPIEVIDDNTFTQRLLRGVTTILKSRLLMTIFTYNALFASTTVLLSFQRAELVANRNTSTTFSADTSFLANINIASSIAVFAMQSSRLGAFVTQKCGTRGSLSLLPFIRLGGLICLCWWHRSTNGQSPNLILFLVLDEFTRVINLAVAKPVRESLWSDLNSEARYEAKPIIDVLANRWGAGSASFCVSVVSRVLLFLGQTSTFNDKGDPSVLGLPPVLFLGLIVSAWWLGVSLDLGQLRARIDLELKKHR
mmetsp:Transcript_22489/g.25310  ORF Transcript_22489/g.25310 Transcript_22489/m.25310 type:complete len:995 (+) Transcript_22489:34-3018(+)